MTEYINSDDMRKLKFLFTRSKPKRGSVATALKGVISSGSDPVSFESWRSNSVKWPFILYSEDVFELSTKDGHYVVRLLDPLEEDGSKSTVVLAYTRWVPEQGMHGPCVYNDTVQEPAHFKRGMISTILNEPRQIAENAYVFQTEEKKFIVIVDSNGNRG